MPEPRLNKGETIQTTPSPVVQYYAVPESMRNIHFHVIIVVDVMFVNSLTFLVIVSKSLKYTTSIYLKSRKKTQLILGLTKFIQLYAKYGL